MLKSSSHLILRSWKWYPSS